MKTLLVVLCLVLPVAARADVPPPDDYVETCTVAKQTVAGLECKDCRAWHGERDACDKTLGKEGYRKMCQSWGASAWGEVWCKGEPKPAEPAQPATTPKKSSCAAGGFELWSLIGVALFLRRRR